MKKTYRFSEVIKVKDGRFCNLSAHMARMNRTAARFFGTILHPELEHLEVPAEYWNGLVKCRIEYTDRIQSVEFTPYAFRPVSSVSLIYDDVLEYVYKSTNRDFLDKHLSASGCDEIVVVKHGFITDTSFSNLVFETETGHLYTPTTYLLAGVKRSELLHKRIISPMEIRPENLSSFTKAYLINAMIDLQDRVSLPLPGLKQVSGEPILIKE